MDTNREQGTLNQRRKPKVLLILFLLALVAVFAVGYWLMFVRNRVFTDNAYVMADSAAVSSRIPGTISKIYVENDDLVKPGDNLISLDPSDIQAEVERFRAALSRIQAEIKISEVTIDLIDSETQAGVQASEASVLAAQEKEKELRHHLNELEQKRAAAEAELSRAQKDSQRYANLYQEGAGSEQQKDRSSTTFKKAKADFGASDAQIAAAKASLAGAVQEIDRARAQRDAAKANLLKVDIEKSNLIALKAKLAETQAQLHASELNLSYCTINAPIAGYIAQKRIQVGERIQPGQSLFAIVPLGDVYIEANFKETQLENVRIGQPVQIKADIYHGHVFWGKVSGIRAGTGAAFSLLPSENATGNWIKVVQRIPVRILLDSPPPAEFPLRVGSSLDVTIFTGDTTGHMLRPVKADSSVDSGRS